MKIFFKLLPIFIFLFFNFAMAQKQIVVKNTKEFILALDNNVTIIIDADQLDVSSTNLKKYIQLIPANKAKSIKIHNSIELNEIENLTIKGKKNTKLWSSVAIDDIMSFDNCKNIRLENITLVHQIDKNDTCKGDVLQFSYSSNITLFNCNLDGSGRVGLSAEETKNIICEEVTITNCSLNAISITSESELYMKNSLIHSNTMQSTSVVEALYGSKIHFESCNFYNNFIEDKNIFVIDEDTDSNIKCTGCNFREPEPSFDHKLSYIFSNRFDFIIANKRVNLNYEEEDYNNEIEDELPNKTINVKSIKDFLLALDNNTTIIIHADVLDVTSKKLRAYKEIISKKLVNNILFTDNGLKLVNFKNLRIIGGKSNKTKLVSSIVTDDVLLLENCTNINLENLILVHEVGADSCEGYVLILEKCNTINLYKCELDGSGAVGLYANQTKEIYGNKLKISNNATSGITFVGASEAAFLNSQLVNNHSSTSIVRVKNGSKIEFFNSQFIDDYPRYDKLFEKDDYNNNEVKSSIKCNNCMDYINLYNESDAYENGIKKSPIISYRLNFDENFQDYDLFNYQDPNKVYGNVDYSNDNNEKEIEEDSSPPPPPILDGDEIVYQVQTHVEDGNSFEDHCINLSYYDLSQMKDFGISNNIILQYCKFINDNISAFCGFDLISDDPNANDKKNKIINFLKWEDNKENNMMYEISNYFSFPLTTYWNKKNVYQEDLEKMYIANRALLLASLNNIRMIKQISENVFEVQLVYCFMTKKNKTPQVVASKLKIEFEFGKIKSIYPV
jgi:hypothetical protein